MLGVALMLEAVLLYRPRTQVRFRHAPADRAWWDGVGCGPT